jgi:hypothetical protein
MGGGPSKWWRPKIQKKRVLVHEKKEVNNGSYQIHGEEMKM